MVGQVAGVIAICASVTPGSSDVAALRTAARAAAGSFCRAISRTPSRAAADSVPCTWKARPNSAMPSTRRISSGRIMANSTADAPRSSFSRLRILLTSVLESSGSYSSAAAPVRGPLRRGVVGATRTCSAADDGQGRADLGEQVAEPATQQRDGGDDGDGDQADHEAVLDGGRALLVLLEAVLGEGDQADQGCVRLQHVDSRGDGPAGPD